jgi:four helix bundle protein
VAFRFETLDVWQIAADLAMPMFRIADDMERRKLFRFADQVRGAALSISNNIAEGSGSTSDRDFIHFLNIARRSTFECASMMLVPERNGVLTVDQARPLLPELNRLAGMITAFARSLEARPLSPKP